MTAPLEGLVVDIDDTLYLEREYVRSGFAHVEKWCVRELEVSGVGARAWALFVSGTRRTNLTDALLQVGVEPTPDLLEQLVAQYRAHAPSVELLPDALDFLTRWAGRVPIAVVTDGPAVSQRAKCEALDLSRWAETLVVTAEHGSSKPDPRMFCLASEGWNAAADNIVYVADNPAKDFEGPLELGWRGVRVRRRGALHETVPTPPKVAEVEHLWTPSGLDAWWEAAQ